MSNHYVIIGSGIAGLVAAETLRKEEPKADISIVSEEPHDFYSRPGLAYFLRGDFPEKQLYVRSPEDVRKLNARRIHAKVEQILCAEHELLLADGKKVRYDRLLLATGALSVPPSFPGCELAGVVTLDGLNDTRHIIEQARRSRPAVVIGGGITALELAEGFACRGMKVNYFLRGKLYWADVLDETESKIVMERLRHEGVTIHTETQIKQALGVNGKIASVETQAGAILPCELLAVAIGVRPRSELAQKAGLTMDKGVVVNEYLQTSESDIYAAGDVAEAFDPVTKRRLRDVLWPTAIDQGKIAGANMAGRKLAYVKGIPFNVTMLTGLKVTIIGAIGGGKKNDDLITISRGESEAWRIAPNTSGTVSGQDDVNRVRMVIGERAIVGALVMGNQSWSRPLQRLIVAQSDITPIREALLGGGAESMAQLAHFYRDWEEKKAARITGT